MKKKLIGTILTLLCTGVVAFSGWQVYKIMSEYQSGEKVYLELEEYVSPPTEEKNTDHQTESSESENKTILPVVEFEKLKSIIKNCVRVQETGKRDNMERFCGAIFHNS